MQSDVLAKLNNTGNNRNWILSFSQHPFDLMAHQRHLALSSSRSINSLKDQLHCTTPEFVCGRAETPSPPIHLGPAFVNVIAVLRTSQLNHTKGGANPLPSLNYVGVKITYVCMLREWRGLGAITRHKQYWGSIIMIFDSLIAADSWDLHGTRRKQDSHN